MTKWICAILVTACFVSCSHSNKNDSINHQSEVKYDPKYEKALLTCALIDSINASLEWKEVKPGLWISNKGDLGIQDSKMIFLDSMLFVTDYITKVDTTPLNQIINIPTFEHLGSYFYKDAYHIYHYYPMAYRGTFSILDTADRESFHIVGDCYAQDIHHVYSEKGEILDNIDYNTFFTVKEAGCFAKDKNGYYFWGDRIEQFEMDSVYMLYINILDEAYHAMDTIFSEMSEYPVNDLDGKTIINFKNFKLEIDAFFETKHSKDTAYIFESVGEYLYGRKLKIKPKNDLDTFHLYIQSVDYVSEMMETDSIGYLDSWDNWEPITFYDTSDLFYWQHYKSNAYIFPNIGYYKSYLMQQRIKKFGFSDTTYWYHGEMSGDYLGEAWLYQGKIVQYWIFHAFVKIERHNNGLQETKWLKLEFSYGC